MSDNKKKVFLEKLQKLENLKNEDEEK